MTNNTQTNNNLPQSIIDFSNNNGINSNIHLPNPLYLGLTQAEAMLIEVNRELYVIDRKMKWKDSVPIFIALAALLLSILAMNESLNPFFEGVTLIAMYIFLLTPVVLYFLPESRKEKQKEENLIILKQLLERELKPND